MIDHSRPRPAGDFTIRATVDTSGPSGSRTTVTADAHALLVAAGWTPPSDPPAPPVDDEGEDG